MLLAAIALGALGALGGCGSGSGDEAAQTGAAVALPALDEAARHKLDARLLQLYRALSVSPPDLEAVAVLGGLIEVAEQDGRFEVGVLVQADATDAVLSSAGLRVSSRAGRIVGGTIAVAALPALAALEAVERGEAARRLRLT